MPYIIRKLKDGWYVINTQTGKRKNSKPYPSRKAALPYFKKLQMIEHQ